MNTPNTIDITQQERAQLIKAQQGELDAVPMYRKLADITKDEKAKKIFLQLATDEGKHAGILKKYTGENLQPKNTLAHIIAAMYRVLGKKFTLKLMAKGEFQAVGKYEPLLKKIPDIQEIMNDEENHGHLLSSLL